MNNIIPAVESKRPTSRRFNEPPVKLACLSCRALRIRCNGQAECANCAAKGRTCCYVPSRRGGPRNHQNRRNRGAITGNATDLAEERNPLAWGHAKTGDGARSTSVADEWVSQLGGLCGPGAGLRNVDVPLAEIDSIFDTIFAPASKETTSDSQCPPTPNQIRIYDCNEDLLGAYYLFIHPYFPILPPPEALLVNSSPVLSKKPPSFEPSNPLGRAIAAVLVLIPHPDEKEPSRPEYLKIRRDFGHCFAKSALDAVEIDYEPSEVCNDPQNPSQNEEAFDREPFHPKLPVCLEGVVALAILSVYEYAQQGNLDRMLHRANQSLALAMSMSLHEALDEDGFAEARQRAWWMTYMTACQASAVSNTPPAFNLYDPWFVTPYPEGWKLLVEAQQAILESATFARDLDETMNAGSDISWIQTRMTELDSQIASLLLLCRDPPPVSQMAPPSDSPEFVVSKTMRAFAEIKLHTARIKTHRLCAFQDMNILPRPPVDETTPTATIMSDHQTDIPCEMRSNPVYIQDPPISSHAQRLRFPFSSEVSSKICLHAAFNVVTLLDNLPHPNPTNEISVKSPPFLLRGSLAEFPRTMPTLVCCAMQSGYAMLMLCVKARDLQSSADGSSTFNFAALKKFRNELHQSLQLVVKCLENYAVAYEALQGIRDEIVQAIEREFQH